MFPVISKLKLTPDKTEFFFIGKERQRSKYSPMFPIEPIGVHTNPAKSAWNLEVIFYKNFTSRSHISAVCSSCFYHMRDLRRIRCSLISINQSNWITQNYLQILWCLVALIMAIHFCLALQTLTSPNFNLFRIGWPMLWLSHHYLLSVLHYCVSFIGCQYNLESISRSVCWPTWLYVTLLYSTSLPSWSVWSNNPSWSVWSNKRITLLVPRVKTTQVRCRFTLVPLLFGTSRYLSAQPPQL